MNQINLIGNLTKDIEILNSKAGKPFAKGSIAVSDKFKKEKTHFFNFTAFGKTAEVMSKFLSKGSKVGLSGSISHDTWKSKEGKTLSTVSIVVESFTFCSTKGEMQNETPMEKAEKAPDPFEDFAPVNDSETPF